MAVSLEVSDQQIYSRRRRTQRKMIILAVLVVLAEYVLQKAEGTRQQEPNVIGVLANLHRGEGCNITVLESVQQLLAAEWAVGWINERTPQSPLKIEILDTCEDKDVANQDIYNTIKSAIDHQERGSLLGIMGFGEQDIINSVVSTLHAFNIPVIVTSSHLAESVPQMDNILTTAPKLSSLIMPAVSLAKELAIKRIALISSCPQTIQNFPHIASENGVTSTRTIQVVRHSKVIGEIIKISMEDIIQNETLVLILEPREVEELAKYLLRQKLKKSLMITATIGLDKNLIKLWRTVFANSYLIEPVIPELPDFKKYVVEKLSAAQEKDSALLQAYVMDHYHCYWNVNNSGGYTQLCNQLSASDLTTKLIINPEVVFTVKAISAYSAAILILKQSNQSTCDSSIQSCILSILQELSLGHGATLTESINKEGHVIPSRYVILKIGRIGDLTAVGWYSEDSGLLLDLNHNNENVINNDVPKTKTLYPEENNMGSIDMQYVNIERVTHDNDMLKVWLNITAAMASIGLIVTFIMIVYVCYKLYDGTIGGNQSLGIVLLFAVLILYTSIILFIFSPNGIRCIFRQLIYPMALTLCYAILLVKVMQLRSLVLLGLGGRISFLNQYMVLFFIVLVQAVLCIQMAFSDRNWILVETDGTVMCSMKRSDFLTLHTYSVILALVSFIYGLSVLKIRRNYKEGKWVTIASGLSIPILLGWGLIKLLVAEVYHEAGTCFSLLIISTILVGTIFFPKMSTISKQDIRRKKKKINFHDPVFTIFTELQPQVRKHNHSMPEYLTKNPIYQPSTSI